MGPSAPNISIIIPTRNRADSLRITLECLAAADRKGVTAQVIVVDNGSNDHTKAVAAAFGERIAVRYLYEPAQGIYGKSHSLNAGLELDGLGDLIVVLDDDMSPRLDWFQEVISASRRWPDQDFFGGGIDTVWPCADVPDWARIARLEILVLSGEALGDAEIPLPPNWWFGGNHFWFRSRVLEGKRRFKDIWLTEPDFQLQLVEEGFSGMWCPRARSGHRVQPGLLQEKAALERATKVGVCTAWVRLQPFRKTSKQAQLFRDHPWTSRGYFLAKLLLWRALLLISGVYPKNRKRFEKKCMAVYRSSYYGEILRVAASLEEYSLWNPRARRALAAATPTRVGNAPERR